MRKYLCILLSTMMVLLIFTSCSNAPETKKGIDNADTSSSDNAALAADETLPVESSSEAADEQANEDALTAQEDGTVITSGDQGDKTAVQKNTAGSAVKSASSAAGSSSGTKNTSSANTSSVKNSSPPPSGTAGSSKPTTSSKPASSAPSKPSTTQGSIGSFTMTDLNGNTANQSILSNYKLTMINVWATYCNPCIEEIPAISSVYNQVKSKGVNIIGVASDGAGKTDVVKEIVSKTGATYKMYIPSSSMLQNSFMSDISFVPTTFFVDQNGNIVGKVTGSKSADAWLKTVNDMLARVS